MTQDTARLKIFPRLLLTMMLLTLIPLVSLWYIDNLKSQRVWKSNLESSLSQTSDALAAKVNEWTDMNLRSSIQNAKLNALVSMQPEQMEPVLESIQDTYEWLYLVHVIDADGHQIARSDRKSTLNDDGSRNDKYFRNDRNYFQSVKAGEPVGQQVLISKSTGNPGLVMSVPIKDPSGQFLGILTRSSHLVRISELVTAVSLGTTGFAILVDSDGKIIAHGRPENVAGPLQDISDHPALKAGVDREQVIFEEADANRVVAYPQKTGLGWTLILQQDHDDAFAPLQQAQRNAFILLILTLLFVVAVTFLFARGLVKPLQKLTAAASQYSLGKMETEIPGTRRGDEIGDLARATHRMGISVRMAIERIK